MSANVIQADRELFKRLRGISGPSWGKAVDAGEYDGDPLMQLLASHRIAALEEAVATAERVRDLTTSKGSARHAAITLAAKAIRNLISGERD